MRFKLRADHKQNPGKDRSLRFDGYFQKELLMAPMITLKYCFDRWAICASGNSSMCFGDIGGK